MANAKGHYVPIFYLKGFTKTDDEWGELFVRDRARGQWQSTPRNSASQRGMYEVHGPDPLVMERTFSEVESMFRDVLNDTLQRRQFPDGEQWRLLLDFVATMAVRVPSFRATVNAAQNEIYNELLHRYRSTPEWRQCFDTIVQSHEDIFGGITFEKYQQAVLGGLDFSMTRNEYVRMIPDSAAFIWPHLYRRRWVLWTCHDQAPDLICSDNPVAITTIELGRPSPQIGFDASNTLVVCPLNRRIVMVGASTDHVEPALMGPDAIAQVNAATAMGAQQLYSSS